jgi:putative ABC transport system substrate-binding protein
MIVVTLAAWCASSNPAAQESTLPRIAVLAPDIVFPSAEAGLQEGLQELGYVNGQNVRVEWRRSAGTLEDLRSLAADLVRTKVDVLVTAATPATRAALQVTTTVPVVFLVGDPVLLGFADSLARPGGNATGVSLVDRELSAKRLEFLRLCVPGAKRILYLMNSSNPMAAPMLRETERAAQTLGVALVRLDVRNAGELDNALQTVLRSREDGILVSPDPLFYPNSARLTAAVRKARLPGMFPFREYHEHGALMSYGPNFKEVWRRAAAYVDRILKGAKPADLPIDQISTYELVIDLRTAGTVGVTLSQDLLMRADEVIR